jgi:hypothetical protein
MRDDATGRVATDVNHGRRAIICFRLHTAEAHLVRAAAAQRGETVSDLLRHVVGELLERELFGGPSGRLDEELRKESS